MMSYLFYFGYWKSWPEVSDNVPEFTFSTRFLPYEHSIEIPCCNVTMSNGVMDNLGVENPPTYRTIGELGGRVQETKISLRGVLFDEMRNYIFSFKNSDLLF